MSRARLRFAAAAALAAALAGAGCAAPGPESQVTRGAPITTTPPDPAVVDLMEATGMTPEARRMFLTARPSLEDKATITESCAGLDAAGIGTTHTYGCVVQGKIHIRVFGATELADMRYVVAAHELLHVVYANLRTAERVRLDAELERARAGDAVLEERLEVYAASAGDTPNEVHAVLGTEFAGLSPELEAHYARFFDRSLVLSAFQRTLGDREAAIRALEAKVDELKGRLDAMSAEMDALRADGDLRTFNARVPTYNALVRQINAAIADLRKLVDAHKALVSS